MLKLHTPALSDAARQTSSCSPVHTDTGMPPILAWHSRAVCNDRVMAEVMMRLMAGTALLVLDSSERNRKYSPAALACSTPFAVIGGSGARPPLCCLAPVSCAASVHGRLAHGALTSSFPFALFALSAWRTRYKRTVGMMTVVAKR